MGPVFVNRGRLEIIYAILSVCRKPAGKTRILYKCNLSYEQLLRYLRYLVSRGLVDSPEKGRKELFQVTDRGRRFLQEYENLSSFVKETS